MDIMSKAGSIRTTIFKSDHPSKDFNTWAEEHREYLIISMDFKMVPGGMNRDWSHVAIFVVYSMPD